jgi:alkylhydroperoxidase family enzyme
LSLRQREIFILRTCAGHRSEYEWGVHVTLYAHKAQLTAEQIEATVLGDARASCWSALERQLIELSDHLRVETTLAAQFWVTLREHFSDLTLIELLMLSGFYRTVSTLTNALELPPEKWAARFPVASTA